MISHGELTVEQNAKVVNDTWELHCGIRQGQHVCRDFTELATWSQPDGLRFVFVQLQTVAGHPDTDPRDAFAETSHRVRVIRGWGDLIQDFKIIKKFDNIDSNCGLNYLLPD